MRTVLGVRTRKQFRRVTAGPEVPTPTVWFDSWRKLAGLFSDESRALLHLIRNRQHRTAPALAESSGQAASNLPRTPRHLERDGLVRRHRGAHARALRPEAIAIEFLSVLD